MDIVSTCRFEVRDLDVAVPPEYSGEISRFTVKSMTMTADGAASFDLGRGEFVRGGRKGVVRSEIVMKPTTGEERVSVVEGTIETTYELMNAAGGVQGTRE